MNRLFSHIIIVSLALGIIALQGAYFNFDEMERHFQEMHESMEQSFNQIRKQMHDSFKGDAPYSPWKVDCIDSQDGQTLIVTVIGVETQDVRAQLNENNMYLTVVTDNGTVNIKASKNWISVAIKQSREAKKKSKKVSAHSASMVSKSTSRTVTYDVDLAEAKVDYSSKNKMLIIMIPYKKEIKRGRTIPVTIDTDLESDDSRINMDGEQEDALEEERVLEVE